MSTPSPESSDGPSLLDEEAMLSIDATRQVHFPGQLADGSPFRDSSLDNMNLNSMVFHPDGTEGSEGEGGIEIGYVVKVESEAKGQNRLSILLSPQVHVISRDVPHVVQAVLATTAEIMARSVEDGTIKKGDIVDRYLYLPPFSYTALGKIPAARDYEAVNEAIFDGFRLQFGRLGFVSERRARTKLAQVFGSLYSKARGIGSKEHDAIRIGEVRQIFQEESAAIQGEDRELDWSQFE